MAELEEHHILPSDSESDDDSDDSRDSSISFEAVANPLAVKLEAYTDSVMIAFRGNREKTLEFLSLIADFNNNRIGFRRFLLKIKVLLVDHPELAVGLNTFLPTGYKISIPIDSNIGSGTRGYENVIEFIKEVKNEFPNDIRIRNFLLDILIEYHTQRKSLHMAHQEGSALFHDKPELLEDYKLLFPPQSKTSAEEVHRTEPNEKSIKEKKSLKISYLVPSLIALLLVAYGLVTRFLLHQ